MVALKRSFQENEMRLVVKATNAQKQSAKTGACTWLLAETPKENRKHSIYI